MTLPPGLLLTYYGDDFTGSTDTMEVLAQAGIRTLLFMDPPSPDDIARHGDVRAVGVAGSARTMSPARMDATLPAVFADLVALGAPILRYKVCSTFDSSPTVGSIGRAIDIGAVATGSRCVPLIVGAPALGRYCVFGNLFARSGLDSPLFRLDRHPTMSRHPVTPMDESDVRVHLARQTARPVALVDVLDLDAPPADLDATYAKHASEGDGVVLFDALTDEHLAAAGRVVWNAATAETPLFVAGSSGAEYALVAHWRREGVLPSPPVLECGSAEAVVVLSGSCSPVTARQIDHATGEGFKAIALDTATLVSTSDRDEVERRVSDEAAEVVHRGRSVILHTAMGPDDPRVPVTVAHLGSQSAAAESLGGAMGRILAGVLARTSLTRAVVTGGDTSYHVARALGVRAVETLAPIQPGSPMCRVHAQDPRVDGIEMLFKGGQVGRPDIFVHAVRGSPT
jgi:uncharacterized protein YgbK (DUF1537 family)